MWYLTLRSVSPTQPAIWRIVIPGFSEIAARRRARNGSAIASASSCTTPASRTLGALAIGSFPESDSLPF